MKIELEIKLIIGHITFENIETGYWILTDEDNKYRIINMPEELKKDRLKIASIVKIIDNETSIYITSNPIHLIEYKIIN